MNKYFDMERLISYELGNACSRSLNETKITHPHTSTKKQTLSPKGRGKINKGQLSCYHCGCYIAS